MSPLDLARSWFPDESDEALKSILWNQTSFPFSDAAHLHNDLRELRSRIDAGQTKFCDFCNSEPLPDKDICKRCDDALHPLEDEQ